MKGFARFGALVALASLSLSAQPFTAQPFTIDQVLGAPFPSALTASASGDKIAWVFDSRGVRNLWVAEGPGFKARQLTAYTQDTGEEIDEVAWSSDGNTISFVRGSAANPTDNPTPLLARY